MTAPPTHQPETTAELSALARGLAIVTGGAVMTISAFAWGLPGLRAATIGATLSVLNVFLLTRFARQAVLVAAAGGPNTATVRLTSALGAKTVVLLTTLWVACKTTDLLVLPLALGLLVTVFCLLVAGLFTALRAE
jgi:hypothetical protein